MNNILIENKDYLFLPDLNDEKAYNIRILSGDYENVEFKYLTVKFTEPRKKDDDAKCTFTYEVSKDLDIILNKADFEKHLGLILHSILTNITETNEFEIVDNDGTGKTNNKEFNPK